MVQLHAAWWEWYESVLQGVLVRLRGGARWGKISDIFGLLRQFAARAASLEEKTSLGGLNNDHTAVLAHASMRTGLASRITRLEHLRDHVCDVLLSIARYVRDDALKSSTGSSGGMAGTREKRKLSGSVR